ncbi:MAG: DUF6263 family protein [Ferruginibacter sp.]
MKKTVLTFTLTTLIGATSIFAQTVKLKLNKGEKFESVSVTSINNTTEAMGQTMEMTGTTNTVTQYTVNDARTADYDLSTTLAKMQLKMSMMGQEMEYDSEKKDNDEKLAAVGKMVGKVKNTTVDEKGAITKKEAEKKSEEDEAGNMLTSMMNPAAAATSNNFELYIPSIYAQTLEVGKSWQDSTTSVTEKSTTKSVGTFTVKSLDAEKVVLNYEGTQTSSGTMEQQGMEMKTEGNNKVTTEYTVDVKSGLILENKTTIVTNVNIEVTGMTIPSTGTVTTTTKLTVIK